MSHLSSLLTLQALQRLEIPAGGQLVLVGDLHGQYDDFLAILDKVGAYGSSKPESIEIIQLNHSFVFILHSTL